MTAQEFYAEVQASTRRHLHQTHMQMALRERTYTDQEMDELVERGLRELADRLGAQAAELAY